MSAPFCSGEHLANRAADGKAYPDHGPSPFGRIATRDDGSDDCGEPLCSEVTPPVTKPAFSFFDEAASIVRSQHHLNTEAE